jgi:asparagine synthase (glutamine-hydrolysing)
LLIKKLYPHLAHYSNPQQFGLMRMYYEGFLDNADPEMAGLNIRVHNNQVLLNFFNKAHAVQFDKARLLERLRALQPDAYKGWTLLRQNQFLEMKTLLSGYLLSSQADRMTMAHGVEGRYPFLDHRVVEKVFSFPDNFKLNGFLQKFLLSESYKDKIPGSIIQRAKKPYTAPDLKSFYHGGKLSEQAAFFLSPDLIKNYGVFEPRVVERLLNKFERRIPPEIGYRDNMLITFILSCQMARHWAARPDIQSLDETLKTVALSE